MKILNLYAGIGGNRKLWGDQHEVTAVEINEEIAGIYKENFPNDTVITSTRQGVADAHQFLLEHYNDGWDFIWSSPPCPTHSRIRNIAGVGRGQNKPVYPDMSLYQEIIFLQQITESSGTNFTGKWVVENVMSYYKPLIPPKEIHRHYFWANFPIPYSRMVSDNINIGGVKFLQKRFGFPKVKDLKLLRNCVNPILGLHVFRSAFKDKQRTLFHISEFPK